MNMQKSMNRDEASVSRLAYQLWEDAGRPVGRDLEFWLAAESQLRAPTASRSSAPVAEVVIKESATKATRPTRGSAKKTWPKPYPNLPKF